MEALQDPNSGKKDEYADEQEEERQEGKTLWETQETKEERSEREAQKKGRVIEEKKTEGGYLQHKG